MKGSRREGITYKRERSVNHVTNQIGQYKRLEKEAKTHARQQTDLFTRAD